MAKMKQIPAMSGIKRMASTPDAKKAMPKGKGSSPVGAKSAGLKSMLKMGHKKLK